MPPNERLNWVAVHARCHRERTGVRVVVADVLLLGTGAVFVDGVHGPGAIVVAQELCVGKLA